MTVVQEHLDRDQFRGIAIGDLKVREVPLERRRQLNAAFVDQLHHRALAVRSPTFSRSSSGRCIFNPCRRGPFVIDTYPGLLAALKNPLLREVLERLYPERVKFPPRPPNPPDPPFRPIVIDLFNEASQPQTALLFQRSEAGDSKARKAAEEPEFAVGNFRLARTVAPARAQNIATSIGNIEIARAIGGIFFPCFTEAAANITLSFDEYDRTAAELAGGAYTGTGPRRLLGDTITDMNGNYIFRFTFDLTFPGLEDAPDVAPGEDVNVVLYPDVIVKVLGQSFQVQWESAPYYNIPNLRRIDLCLPKDTVHVSSVCFNGSLIGSLGNVFIGGNQNTTASTAVGALRRYGFSNFLDAVQRHVPVDDEIVDHDRSRAGEDQIVEVLVRSGVIRPEHAGSGDTGEGARRGAPAADLRICRLDHANRARGRVWPHVSVHVSGTANRGRPRRFVRDDGRAERPARPPRLTIVAGEKTPVVGERGGLHPGWRSAR